MYMQTGADLESVLTKLTELRDEVEIWFESNGRIDSTIDETLESLEEAIRTFQDSGAV